MSSTSRLSTVLFVLSLALLCCCALMAAVLLGKATGVASLGTWTTPWSNEISIRKSLVILFNKRWKIFFFWNTWWIDNLAGHFGSIFKLALCVRKRCHFFIRKFWFFFFLKEGQSTDKRKFSFSRWLSFFSWLLLLRWTALLIFTILLRIVVRVIVTATTFELVVTLWTAVIIGITSIFTAATSIIVVPVKRNRILIESIGSGINKMNAAKITWKSFEQLKIESVMSRDTRVYPTVMLCYNM